MPGFTAHRKHSGRFLEIIIRPSGSGLPATLLAYAGAALFPIGVFMTRSSSLKPWPSRCSRSWSTQGYAGSRRDQRRRTMKVMAWVTSSAGTQNAGIQ